MKLEQAYAEALYESAKDKSGSELKKIHENFKALLIRRGHERLLSRISLAVLRLEEKSRENHTATLISAKDLDIRERKEIQKSFETLAGRTFEFMEKKDESIVGGYAVLSRDMRLDNTFKRSLFSLYQKLIV